MNIIANYFIGKSYPDRYDDANTISANANTIVLTFEDSKFNSVNDFKAWLSTHNTKVKYILEEPIDIEITDTTLISQLEAINNAMSYKEQTNILQDNNNLPFILNVSALQKE